MPDVQNRRQPKKTPEPSQAPLWFFAAGLAIIIFSRSVKDEMVGQIFLWFGAACSVVALLYWIFRPKHGL